MLAEKSTNVTNIHILNYTNVLTVVHSFAYRTSTLLALLCKLFFIFIIFYQHFYQ